MGSYLLRVFWYCTSELVVISQLRLIIACRLRSTQIVFSHICEITCFQNLVRITNWTFSFSLFLAFLFFIFYFNYKLNLYYELNLRIEPLLISFAAYADLCITLMWLPSVHWVRMASVKILHPCFEKADLLIVLFKITRFHYIVWNSNLAFYWSRVWWTCYRTQIICYTYYIES